MRAIILLESHGQYDSLEVYCGLSTGSMVFLIFATNYIHVYAIVIQKFTYLEGREVLQQHYSQSPILPYRHFLWVVNIQIIILCGENRIKVKSLTQEV